MGHIEKQEKPRKASGNLLEKFDQFWRNNYHKEKEVS